MLSTHFHLTETNVAAHSRLLPAKDTTRRMKSPLRTLAHKYAAAVARQLVRQSAWDELLLLQGAQAALQVRNLQNLTTLAEAEFKVFSQWGEDGIIEWLVSRLPRIPQSFVEFGVEDYTEANTRFLLSHRNWRGLVLDGSAENIARVKGRPSAWRNDLAATDAFITRENINSLIEASGLTDEIGLLSIDIDGNDYWVWEAITAIKPWIVVVEYNAVLGDLLPITIPYDAGFTRMQAHFSALYYGASVSAFENLAARRGYTLAGSNRAGNNLFYVRNDVGAAIIPFIQDRRARPSLYAEARDAKGALSFVRGDARRNLINDLPVVDLANGQVRPLAEMGALYSSHWTAIQQGKPAPEVQA